MSTSLQDFVDDVVIMLHRTPPATDKEIFQYLHANDVYSHDKLIMDGAKEIIAGEQR